MSPAPSLVAAALLASVHLFSARLRVLDEIPRSRLLSIAGGIAVAYVVLRILPGLTESQEMLERAGGTARFPFVRQHVYLVVLFSIVLFYGLERSVKESRRRRRLRGEEDRTTPRIFWLHTSSFALVNLLIGYLLSYRLQAGGQALLLFTTAMLLKFIVDDHGLHVDHKRAYDAIGRWLLAGSVLLGWSVGYLTGLPEIALALLNAFIGGSILFNVLKEELPEERESRYPAFALGAGTYAALLLAS